MESIESFKKAFRFSNYISTAMLYLKDNYFLERELSRDDIKDRILGHWGTVPGINFIYQGLVYSSKKFGKETLLVTGPGHGAPAVLANSWLEKTISEYYPDEYPFNKAGLEKFIHNFSWPSGFPSHTTPMVPGTIHEGGELGYSLSTAFGAALNNKDLIVGCIIGDGEAESATLSASWQLNKFLNPSIDGAVLPILHLNGYRISGPTVYSTMNDGELSLYFKGLGYEPLFVDQYTATDVHIDLLQTLIKAYKQIEDIKNKWSTYQISNPKWPVVIVRTMKGWTGPKYIHETKIEDNNLSHGIPLQKPKKDDYEFALLKEWLESYNVKELINPKGEIDKDILNFFADGELRISANKHSFGGDMMHELKLPRLEDHEVRIFERGIREEKRMVELSKYLREIFREDQGRNFKFFSPDESESNLLEETFDTTLRQYIWPLRETDDHFSESGGVFELLSENVLFGMQVGYNLTGRHGILISYEAFLNVVSSQWDQHLKYLKQSLEVPFRKPIPSLNLIATSTLWRQEHNGYTHQNPTLINSLIAKHPELVRVYLPADVNSLLVAMEECLMSRDKVNLIIACKRDLPQWISLEEARFNINQGYSIWDWLANDEIPDIVLVSSGDYQTNETYNAIQILRDEIPEIRIKYINVSELIKFSKVLEDKYAAEELFEKDIPIIFNFHGYPSAIKQITWGSGLENRMQILGYIEEGSTTTPFDMEVLNKASRFHVVINALKSLKDKRNDLSQRIDNIIQKYQNKISEHSKFILENGTDLPEVR